LPVTDSAPVNSRTGKNGRHSDHLSDISQDFLSADILKVLIDIWRDQFRFIYESRADLTVCSNSLLSNGLKSRPRNYPFTLVAQGSGVRATEGREFPIGKIAGRNESEPICSLVTYCKCRPGKAGVLCTENGKGQGDLPG